MSYRSATESISLLPFSVNLIRPKPSAGAGTMLSVLVSPVTSTPEGNGSL